MQTVAHLFIEGSRQAKFVMDETVEEKWEWRILVRGQTHVLPTFARLLPAGDD